MIFETGYGPSGLPHIGTFGEVARTTMVRHAFEVLTEGRIPTRLICFSDDMDGLRKVPDNIPNREMVAEHLGKPLSADSRPLRRPSELRPSQQRAPASLPRRVRLRLRVPARPPSATRAAVSTRRCSRCSSITTRCCDMILPTLGPERRATYSRLPADLSRHRRGSAGADHRPRSGQPARSSTRSRRPGSSRRFPSPAAIASCNGRPTGPCAGRRSASTTRWRGRT